jgi:hypothetical protein
MVLKQIGRQVPGKNAFDHELIPDGALAGRASGLSVSRDGPRVVGIEGVSNTCSIWRLVKRDASAPIECTHENGQSFG